MKNVKLTEGFRARLAEAITTLKNLQDAMTDGDVTEFTVSSAQLLEEYVADICRGAEFLDAAANQ